ncbi:MAG: helix-turn-helix domain-containing protein [Bacteroidetes bacterium]|nr:helix-turn-helix domain-containing protein [Bacteroidota bacterium]
MENSIVVALYSREQRKDTIAEVLSELFLKKMEQNNLLKFNEACELLNIHSLTLKRWKSNDIIPYTRIGGLIYFKRDEILDALKDSNYKKLNKLCPLV